MIRLAILLLRPIEAWHAARIERARRKGKFKRPADWGTPCVTTRKKELV